MPRSISLPSVLLLVALLAGCNQRRTAPAALLSPELAAKVDAVLEPWRKPDGPGAAVAILQDGKVVFTKGYGAANLEYGVPVTPASVFHIASESKQFVAFCIVLLAQEGKLSLDDDIRKYLPAVPDFGEKITIRHLIHHTSGLRDQWQLLAISGTRLDDVITQDHILKLVSAQQALNFTPGQRHLYSNTGYTLLAEIVKQVSGKSLREYAHAAIFQPLDMQHTHFHDDYTEVVKDRAYSYNPGPGGTFTNSVLSYSTVGATSLFTTVEDEAKWLRNYETGKVGGPKAIAQMHQLGVLNDGRKLQYAFGLLLDTYKGHRRIGHGGGDAGYRTYTVRFPDQQLGIVLFSNAGHFDAVGTAGKIADLFLPPQAAEGEAKTPVALNESILSRYAGSYIQPEGAPLRVVREDEKLYLEGAFGRAPLETVNDSSFTSWNGLLKLTFARPAPGDNAQSPALTVEMNQPVRYTRYEPVQLGRGALQAYTGTFESDELGERYQVLLKGDELLLRHRKYPDVPLRPVTKEQFSSPHWWMGNLRFLRDNRGQITGLEVNEGRVLHLKFNKIRQLQPAPAVEAPPLVLPTHN